MTITCIYCPNEITESGHPAGRETDVCIGMLLELSIYYHEISKDSRQVRKYFKDRKPDNSFENYQFYFANGKHVPNYSTNIRDAMELWDDEWIFFNKTDIGTYEKPKIIGIKTCLIWTRKTLFSYCKTIDDKYKPIAEAKELALAIVHAKLIEAAKEGANAKAN